MRCQDVQELLPEYVREDVGPAADALLCAHLAECSSCAAIQRREERLMRSLRALPAPAMDPGFPARALRAARQQQPVRPQRWAVAASFLLVCGIGLMLAVGDRPAGPQPVAMSLGQTQMVELKINAPEAFEGVEFEVQLPANVQLKDQPDLREFAWNGSLRPGVNVLSLPLVGIVPQDGQLVATVRFGKVKRTLRIPLEVGMQG